MKRVGFLLVPSLAVLAAIGLVFWSDSARAVVSNADYSGTPSFISNVVTPNVLIMFDNSGTMGMRSFCGAPPGATSNDNNIPPYNTCPTNPAQYTDGSGAPVSSPLPSGAPFVETVTFAGLFDPLRCYSYDNSANRRFVPTTTKAAINTACASTDWDGNLLNYITFRRHDALKKAFIGAQCAVARLADASCPASGSPALITMKNDETLFHSCCDDTSTFPMKRDGCTLALPATVSCANGRVPTAVQTSIGVAPGQSMVFHLRGTGALNGSFCVNNSTNSPPAGGASSCTTTPTGSSTGGKFVIHFTVDTEPRGVIQDLGDKARFGLLEFRTNTFVNDGGIVLVPIGSTQGRTYLSTAVTNYSSNKAAMIIGIEQASSAEFTPLAETLYTGIRYIAQLPQPFGVTSYLYPCAFSGCGPSYPSSTSTAGSIGPVALPVAASEASQLATGDTCPTGLGYISGACGRDPYFFGTNPAWVSSPNPKQISCCKTFIMLLTDGEANSDNALPAAIAEAGPHVHGPACTGSYSPTSPPPTGAAYLAGSGCWASNNPIAPDVLLEKHRTDYTLLDTSPNVNQNHALDDVAYWGHVNDLRQAVIPVTGEAGHDLPGFQNVTVYTVFAFGNINGRELLMQTAKQGGFIDQDGDTLGPGGAHIPNVQSEWDQVDNLTGLLVPDGVPDTYFEAQHGDEIKDKLLAALVSILQKTSSGTSVSVLATSSTGDGAIYQAYFFPTTFVTLGSNTNQVLWTGFTQGLFLDKFGNLHEDYSATGCTGPTDGKLVLIHDCIIKVRLETNPASPNFNSVVVDRFKDDGTAPGSTAGDGLADTTTPFQTVALSSSGVSNIQPMWEGGRRLALLSPGTTCESSTTWPVAGNISQSGNACRRILTWADLSNGGGIGGGGSETLEFSTPNAFTLCPYLGGKAVLYCNGDNAALITAADISADPNLTGCLGITRRACAQNEATNIINWIRGSSVSGLRDRTFNVLNDAGAIVQAQWKLGDVINSSPVVVGAPRERYDVLYGDATYAQFFQRYKDRRQVAFLGANDGMLHAFNAGFFKADESPIDGAGPTVQVRFTTTPKQKGTSTDCAGLPCDAAVTQYAFRTDAPPLGAELWAFIPQDLLPQLRWLTLPNYDHVYYVDLTPKVTDARIFTPDADHPGGWGTILIGGFRLGGSCTNCTSGKGTPRVVQSDFNYDGDTTDTGDGTSGSDYRVFLSSYFVLDITNPEKEPRLLWVFRDKDLGLTTAAPAVLRVNPSTDGKTSSTNEKWYVVIGTGPTHHDAFSTQTAQMFVVDLKQGPSYSDINKTNGTSGSTSCSTTNPCVATNKSAGSGQLRVYSTGVTGAFMADAVTLDSNLDFRTDVIYAGSAICNVRTPLVSPNTYGPCTGPDPSPGVVWRGAMWRLTTNGGDTNPDNWGIASGLGTQVPTTLISTFAYTSSQATTCPSPSPCNVGPITTAPALTQDDTQNLWLFFGTGRYYTNSDKSNVDIQHFFGVKDCIVNSLCTNQSIERTNLFNSSNVVTCTSCAAGTNVSTTGSTTSFTIGFSAGGGNLVNTIQNMDGWFTTFNDPTAPLQTPPRSAVTAGERNLSPSTLIGGTVFFTTFVPTTDICQATGTGQLYAVYYLSGGPYTASAIGTVPSGSNMLASKSLSLGQGLPSQMAIQIGAQGSGTSGTASSAGCAGRITGFIQASTGVLGQTCGSSAGSFWSHLISWRDL